jgi:hypothetical protein
MQAGTGNKTGTKDGQKHRTGHGFLLRCPVLRSNIRPSRARVGGNGKAACESVAAPQADRSERYTNRRRLGYFGRPGNSKNNKHLKAFAGAG